MMDGYLIGKIQKKISISFIIATFQKKLDSDYIGWYKDLDNNLYLKEENLADQLIETHREDLLLMLEVE